MLMIRQRSHQESPPTDRCSLWDKGYAAVRLTLGQDPQLWTQLASKLILQLKNQFVIWRQKVQRDIESTKYQQVCVCRIPLGYLRFSTFILPNVTTPFKWCGYIIIKNKEINADSARFVDRIFELNVFLPVDILWIRGIGDSPVMGVELGAELRALGLPTTLTALTLASIEVFQDTEKKHPQRTDMTACHFNTIVTETHSQIEPHGNVLTWQLWTHSGR